MASSSTTSEPRRFQTEPSSRPITPAPITPRRLGTVAISRAPVESTIKSPSTGATGIAIGSEPEARITLLASRTETLPSLSVSSTFLPLKQSCRYRKAGNAIGFKQTDDTASKLLDDFVFALEHGGDINFHTRSADTVNAKLFFGFVIFKRAIEQCLGGDTANIEAGSTVDTLTVGIFPLLDTGGLKTQLSGANADT